MLHINRDDFFNMRGNRLLRTRHKVGIPPRHFCALVAEQLCKSEFGIVLFCKETCIGVAQAMKNEPIPIFGDAIIEAKFVNNFLKGIIDAPQLFTDSTGKNKTCLSCVEPADKGILHYLWHGNISGLSKSGHTDKKCLLFQDNIVKAKSDFSDFRNSFEFDTDGKGLKELVELWQKEI